MYNLILLSVLRKVLTGRVPRGSGGLLVETGGSPPRIELDQKRLYRHISQSVCPWNRKFSQELAEGSPFAAREFIRGKDAVTLARDILALDQETFGAAFRKSPIKRAKLRGMKRNAAVVLGNMGTPDAAAVLTRARADDEPIVRDHAAWALRTLRCTNA